MMARTVRTACVEPSKGRGTLVGGSSRHFGERPADRVERSLYHRAIGFSYNAVKIFMPAGAKQPVYAPYREHVPPDTAAASLWLRNRRKDEWRDKQSHQHAGPDGGPITLEALIMARLPKKE